MTTLGLHHTSLAPLRIGSTNTPSGFVGVSTSRPWNTTTATTTNGGMAMIIEQDNLHYTNPTTAGNRQTSSLDNFLANLSKVTKTGRDSTKMNFNDFLLQSSSQGAGASTFSRGSKRSLSDVLDADADTYEAMENSRRRKNPRNLSPSPQHVRYGASSGQRFGSLPLHVDESVTISVGGFLTRNEPCSVREEGLVTPKGTFHLGLAPAPTRIVPPSA